MTTALAFSVFAASTVALCSIRAGGFWRFAVRFFATAAAVLMAMSTFSRLMDHASGVFLGMAWEALKAAAKAAGENRRDALAEMGERV